MRIRTSFDDLGEITLRDMKDELYRLELLYGEDVSFIFDAGYNNITCEVILPKKEREANENN